MYSVSHEANVRTMVHAAAQAHINGLIGVPPPPTTPTGTPATNTMTGTPAHYQNELTLASDKMVAYLGGWYEVYNQWNPTGKLDYPVTIIGAYSLPNGTRQPNLTAIANNDAERIQFSQSML